MTDVVPRFALDRLSLFAQHFRVVIVNGPRQAGKTTLLRQFRQTGGGSLRSLDDETTLATATGDARAFAEFGEYPRIIDEIQRGGDHLIHAIKYVVDRDDRRGQFVLSGSTRFLTVPTLSESLAGRAVFVDLWPFSAAERAGAAGDFCSILFRLGQGTDLSNMAGVTDAKWLQAPSPWTRAQYLDLVCAGGYPEAVALPAGLLRSGWYDAYLQTVIQRDVQEFAEIQHAAVVPSLLGLLAARAGSPAVAADLARTVELNHATVRQYLSYLDTVFLTAACHAYSANLTNRLAKTPKVFVTDSGLAAHLLGVDAAAISTPGHAALGGLLETFVFAELTRLLSQEDTRISLMHFKDREGREVDFVLETRDGRVVAIEVKAAQTVRQDDIRHLSWLRDRLGPRFCAGVVLYLGDEPHPFGDRLIAVPLSAMWRHAPLPQRLPAWPPP